MLLTARDTSPGEQEKREIVSDLVDAFFKGPMVIQAQLRPKRKSSLFWMKKSDLVKTARVLKTILDGKICRVLPQHDKVIIQSVPEEIKSG